MELVVVTTPPPVPVPMCKATTATVATVCSAQEQLHKTGRKKMKKDNLVKRLHQFEEQYFDLVWYARGDKTDPDHPGRKAIERIRKEYQDQVAALCGDSSDWHHGFNSGCLATVRLMLGLLGTKEEAEQAEDEFPFLDT